MAAGFHRDRTRSAPRLRSPKGTVNPTGGGAYAVTLAATLKQPDSFAPAAVAFRSDGDLITADQHGNAYG